MNPSTVLILGAGGRFGNAAVEAFGRAGWRVLAQRRRPSPSTPGSPGVQVLTTALDDTDTLAAQARGATAVIHAVNPPYTEWNRSLRPLFLHGVEVARRLRARFMLPGNVYNFGEGMPQRLAVGTPQRPSTVKGRQRCELEAELRARAADGLDSVVIRAGDFFGSGHGSWFDQAIVASLPRGKLVYPGPLDRRHAWAYLPDLAQAFVAVASRPPGPGFIDLPFAGHAVTGAEFLAATEAAAAELGLRPAAGFRHGRLPWSLIRAFGVVHPMSRELARMRYLWRVPHALDGGALERVAGPLPATPLVEALRRALIDLRFGR